METQAIVMLLVGFGLLYGGLAWCIGIAWYHSRQIAKKNPKNNHRRH